MATQASRIEMLASIALLALLVIGCFVILRPFLAALAWALILAITTWPAYEWLLARMRGRRTLAALLMTTLLALAFLLPFAIVAPKLAQNVAALASEGRVLLEEGPPGPPSWVAAGEVGTRGRIAPVSAHSATQCACRPCPLVFCLAPILL